MAFAWREEGFFCEGLSCVSLAEKFGTPLYLYSADAFESRYDELVRAFSAAPALVCFSVKACPNLAVLALLAERGCGFDILSGGELHRVLSAGGDAKRVVFAGVGKSRDEIAEALEAGIRLFNVESEPELLLIDELARARRVRADCAVRLNPDVDPQTHVHITTGRRETKFGLDARLAAALFDRARELSGVKLAGVHMHIGSQITSPSPYADAVRRLEEFVKGVRSRGHQVGVVDVGGGFGIAYRPEETAPGAKEFASVILPAVGRMDCELVLEPGRYISGNSGVLLTRVLRVKRSGDKRFVVVDAAMNDLLRPVLYDAYHEIAPAGPGGNDRRCEGPADIVGPVCETGDFLARKRPFPAVEEGEVLAVFSAGAYGFAMSSNYNSRPRAAEVMVRGGEAFLIRRRETCADIVSGELVPPGLRKGRACWKARAR